MIFSDEEIMISFFKLIFSPHDSGSNRPKLLISIFEFELKVTANRRTDLFAKDIKICLFFVKCSQTTQKLCHLFTLLNSPSYLH